MVAALCTQAYGQRYENTPQAYQDRVSYDISAMQSAIEKCDRSAYDLARSDYDFRAPVAPIFKSAPEYPEPCSRKLRTTNIRTQPEPAKLYSVGRPLEPVKLYSVGTLYQPTKLYSVGTLFVVEPKISVGFGGSSGTSTYDSTGTQAPFSGDWSHSTGQLCGGATLYPGFFIGPARVGFDVNVCSGSNTFGSGDTTMFTIMRHGPGDVALRSTTQVIFDAMVKAEVPLSDPQAVYDPRTNAWYLSVGIGPAFREQALTLTSDQSFFGGGIPSISGTTWQTGFAVSAGLSTFVCPTCIAGNPLKIGIEGRARFFQSQSTSLLSPVFGFTETGSTGSTTDYSALVTLSMPLLLGGDRNSYDVPRSVYVRKDHQF